MILGIVNGILIASTFVPGTNRHIRKMISSSSQVCPQQLHVPDHLELPSLAILARKTYV